MALRLRHRGPDAQGFFQEGAVSLGHRRLSIIDLAGGNQPMADATGRFVTAYNGEIYNHVELREELTGLGRAFGTKCDTEVLLNAYAEWGADCLQRLSGMFSFAIHDRAERRLFLAVDRFGKKPLYYAQRPGLFVFASEPGSLLAHPGLPARIDPAAVYKYLIHDFVPAPSSIYAGVAKLEGGHCLLLDADAPGPVSPRQYWDLRFQPKSRLSFAQATERFRELFSKAVRARLMSDVPLGVYLSGGLDSSCVLAEVVSAAPAVMTFSLGFAERSYDESADARMVARHFGTEHHELMVDQGMMSEAVPEALSACGEPFADTSIVPTFLLNRFARQRITVALGGDGGDELLAGYDPFVAHRLHRLVARMPRKLRDLLLRAPELFCRQSEGYMNLAFRLSQFRRGVGAPVPLRQQLWMSPMLPEEARGLLAPEVSAGLGASGSESPFAEAVAWGGRTDATIEIEQAIYIFSKIYLPNSILFKMDRASMANSLEVRAPFLDCDLAEFVNRLPTSYKMRGLTRKRVLRAAYGRRLPSRVLSKRKQGFALPVSGWMRRGMREMVEDALAPLALKRDGIFDPAQVRRLVDEHMQGRRDHRKALWALFAFQVWRQTAWAA
jgi:asparagine synthase (glutamine-hydrolysing)